MKKVSKKFGQYVVEMRKFKETMGHDDSLPFNAELWVGNTHIANCYNDGWGGETVVAPVNCELFDKVAKEVCATKGALCKEEWSYTMPILADELSWQCEVAKTIEKSQRNGLVFSKEDGNLTIVPFNSGKRKNIPISEMLLSQSGQELIKKTIEKYEKMGLKLVSTNIRYSKVLI